MRRSLRSYGLKEAAANLKSRFIRDLGLRGKPDMVIWLDEPRSDPSGYKLSEIAGEHFVANCGVWLCWKRFQATLPGAVFYSIPQRG